MEADDGTQGGVAPSCWDGLPGGDGARGAQAATEELPDRALGGLVWTLTGRDPWSPSSMSLGWRVLL